MIKICVWSLDLGYLSSALMMSNCLLMWKTHLGWERPWLALPNIHMYNKYIHMYTYIHIYTHTPYTCTYNSIKYICFYFHLLNKVVNLWIKMTNLKGWRKVNVWELLSIKLLAPVLPCIWHRPVSAFPTWRWCGAAIQRPVHCLFMCLRTKPVKLSAPWARVHKEA